MPTKTHLSYLDSIRGLAAFAVFNEHFVIAYGLPCESSLCRRVLDYSPLNIWWDGSAAVSMFFVLSGLVLSLKYFRHGPTPDLRGFNLMGYTLARLFRIWLPYLAVLMISASLYLITAKTSPANTILPASDWIKDMWHKNPLSLTNMLREGFLLKLPDLVVLLPQAWTLSIELALSLLLPLGLVLVEKTISWLIFFTLLSVSLLNMQAFVLHFLLGLLIARQHTVISAHLSQHRWQRRLILLFGLGLYTSGSMIQGLMAEPLVWSSSGLGAGLILMFALGSSAAQGFLSTSLLHRLGRTSYSSYLIHMLILMCVTPDLLKMLENITHNHGLLWLAGWLSTFCIVQSLSWLSYYWIEIPSITMGKRMIAALQTSKTN